MPSNIADQSIFGEYKAPENRLTVALLQILKEGREPLIRWFALQLEFSLPSSDIEIYSQRVMDGCTPDGTLESNFRFQILIESKIKPHSINRQQYEALVGCLNRGESPITLLYITPDSERPSLLADKRIVWVSWLNVRDVLRGFLQTKDGQGRELLSFLVDQFEIFAANVGVLEQRWEPDPNLVLVVAASRALGIAKQFQVYRCQNLRSFRPCRWIAFYANGQIDTIAEIEGKPEDNVVLADRPEYRDLVADDPDAQEMRRLFKLKNLESIGPIKNDLRSDSGRQIGWTQGHRYTTIDRIKKATHTSEL